MRRFIYDSRSLNAKPLDFSNLEIKNLEDILEEEPREGKK